MWIRQLAAAARRASEAAGVQYRTLPLFYTATVTHRVPFDRFDVSAAEYYVYTTRLTNALIECSSSFFGFFFPLFCSLFIIFLFSSFDFNFILCCVPHLFAPRSHRFVCTPGEYNLKLNPVTLDDDGVYQCQVGTGKRDEPAIRSRKSTLTVLVPPDRPRIVPTESITVTENVPLELQCISDGGKPPAVVSSLSLSSSSFLCKLFLKIRIVHPCEIHKYVPTPAKSHPPPLLAPPVQSRG